MSRSKTGGLRPDKQASPSNMPQPKGQPLINPKRTNVEPPKIIVQEQTVSSHSGPIPPAEDLASYNQVVPGLAKIIVDWADQQIAHRHKLEEATTKAEIDHLRASDCDARLGLWLGFCVAMSLIVVSGILAWHGKTWEAVGLSGGTLIGLVSVFVYGSQKKLTPRRKSKPQQTDIEDKPASPAKP